MARRPRRRRLSSRRVAGEVHDHLLDPRGQPIRRRAAQEDAPHTMWPRSSICGRTVCRAALTTTRRSVCWPCKTILFMLIVTRPTSNKLVLYQPRHVMHLAVEDFVGHLRFVGRDARHFEQRQAAGDRRQGLRSSCPSIARNSSLRREAIRNSSLAASNCKVRSQNAIIQFGVQATDFGLGFFLGR